MYPFTNPFTSHLILIPSFKMRIRLFYSRLTRWKNYNTPTAEILILLGMDIQPMDLKVIYLDFREFYNIFNNIKLCLYLCLFWRHILKENDFPNLTIL